MKTRQIFKIYDGNVRLCCSYIFGDDKPYRLYELKNVRNQYGYYTERRKQIGKFCTLQEVFYSVWMYSENI